MMTTVEKLQGMLKLEPVKDGETGVYLGLKITFGAESVTMNMDAALHFLDALHEAMGFQETPQPAMELVETEIPGRAFYRPGLGNTGEPIGSGDFLASVGGGVPAKDNPQPTEEDLGVDGVVVKDCYVENTGLLAGAAGALNEALNEIKEGAAPPPDPSPGADTLDVVD